MSFHPLPSDENGPTPPPHPKPPTPQVSIIYSVTDEDYHSQLYRGIRHLETRATLTIRHLSLERFPNFQEATFFSSQVVLPIITPGFLASPVYRETIRPLLQRWHTEDVGSVIPLLMENTEVGDDPWLSASRFLPDRPFFFARRVSGKRIKRLGWDLFQPLAGHIVDRATDLYRSNVLPRIPPLHQKHLFISYSRRDFKTVGPIRMELERRGVITWMDHHNLLPGVNWSEKLDQALREAWAVLLVYSPAADRSKYVNYEWAYGRGHGCCLVPLMIEEVHPLHPRLGLLQIVDWSIIKPRDFPYDDLLSELMELEWMQDFE